MGKTYFCFSDEFGDYKPSMADSQIKIHPVYIRSTLVINSSDWKKLSLAFQSLKKEFNIPVHQEIKWSQLWRLREIQKKGIKMKENSDLQNLSKFEYQELIKFVSKSVQLITDLDDVKVIATITINKSDNNQIEENIIKWHLQDTMQRIEMEMQFDAENLAVLFVDPVSTSKNELFRKTYFQFFLNGDFIENYKHIKDSINIENSHQSVGIQIADYISGCIGSMMKANPSNNSYSHGISIFKNYIKPILRTNLDGKIIGYGLIDVPKSTNSRQIILRQLKYVTDSTL